MESKTISILGCGWLGLPLAHHLAQQGYAVKGSTTTPMKLVLLRAEGIEPYLLELDPTVHGDQVEDFFKSDILFLNIPPGRKGGAEAASQFEQMMEAFQTEDTMVSNGATTVGSVADLPDVGAFVAGLGTGGTVTGVGRRLKRWNPDVKVYAAEPEYGDLVYGLRNLDEGYVPEVLDQSVLDSRIKVDSLKALTMTRRLAEEEGIFAGVSTGASLQVAVRVCKRLPEGSKIVALSPDGGWKYLSTGAYAPGDVEDIASRIANTLWA